ncbi:hypothetical protein MPF19_18790 [Polaribacter sp. Z014]|uniref:hypothetical protein n=1 Tax=Polaribacter sp. Z014 TaxID=2927126 RepID=UPI00201FCBAA|nr:hypothetical protein [Polaribacter sp. Z014]MCL7765470.1 hypothetical protein [Polaribacter sp. Z014]
MKKILLLIFIFSFNINSQIKGEYSNGNGEDYRTIIFQKDYTFQYLSGGCVSESHGNGHYEIKDKKLYLKFQKQSAEFNSKYYSSSHRIIKTSSNKKDSITIKVKVLDEYENPFPYSYLKDSTENLGASDLNGQIKSINGNTEIKLPFSESNYFIQLSSMGTESYPINIIPNKNYEIEVTLKAHSERKEIIQGIILEYEIIKIKRKILELKLGESSLIYKRN